jgi:RNA polymerase sigma-32 factor
VTLARDGRTRSLWLAQALDELSAREKTIIEERRLRDDTQTLEALGHKLGFSKERVRQIEHRALEKLRFSLLQRSARPNHLS